jgi:NADPH2:quinone reductase
VLIDDPGTAPDVTPFKTKTVSIAWEFMHTRSMFPTDNMAEQDKLLAAQR